MKIEDEDEKEDEDDFLARPPVARLRRPQGVVWWQAE
jgi:P pilus assembly chaperone PapD